MPIAKDDYGTDLFGGSPEPNAEILRGVYPAQKKEILRFTQDDQRGAQGDNSGFSTPVTLSETKGLGLRFKATCTA